MPQNANAFIVCEHCGATKRKPPSQIHAGRQFCGRACQIAYGRCELTCASCGITFSRVVSQLRKAKVYYCSRACKVSKMFGPRVPLAERLARLTDRTGDCWIWIGSQDDDGYGRFGRVGERRHPGAHRVAWEVATGETLTDEQCVLHTCDRRLCVRNDDEGVYEIDGRLFPRRGHLFVGTTIDNQADKVAKGRQARGLRQGKHTKPDAFPRGSQTPAAKLTEDDVREIRRMYRRGLVIQVELARIYRMNQSTISAITRGATWRHV